MPWNDTAPRGKISEVSLGEITWCLFSAFCIFEKVLILEERRMMQEEHLVAEVATLCALALQSEQTLTDVAFLSGHLEVITDRGAKSAVAPSQEHDENLPDRS